MHQHLQTQFNEGGFIMKMKVFRLTAVFLSVFLLCGSLALAAPGDLDRIKAKEKNQVSQSSELVIKKVPNSKLFSNLQERLKSAKAEEKMPVIITFSEKNQTKNKQVLQNRVASFSADMVYKNIPAIATKLTKKQIEAVASLPEVKQIEYDEPVHATMQTANHWSGTEKARADFGITGDRDGNQNSYSKDDVVIAVIDTGIDANHVDLSGGKVIGWRDFVNNRTSPYDDQGHGTHVAGIAAGSGAGNAAYKGVAPGAALVGIKVLDRNGSGTMSNVIAGIDWAISNKDTYGIDIINMSLGTTGSSDGRDATSQAANRAADAGIVVAVAAGNSGPAKQTIGSPGAAEKALTVGAMADPGKGGFNLANFSSRGPTADGRNKPDIAAPGYQINAARANSGNGYVAYSGTSMATPFAAGTVALMLAANPSLSPNQVKSMLASTSQDWGPAGNDVDYGAGKLDGYEAVKAAGGFSGTGPSLPNHLHQAGNLSGTGAAHEWKFDVTNTSEPISITMIIPNWRSYFFFWGRPDFDIYLYDPSGRQVASSTSSSRQETITFNPTQTGTYTLRVYSYAEGGDYFFDISAHASNLRQ